MEIIEIWRSIAEDPTANNRDRIDAGEHIMAHGWGKPTQRTEVTSEDGGPITTVFISAPRPGDIVDADGVVVLPAPTEHQLPGP